MKHLLPSSLTPIVRGLVALLCAVSALSAQPPAAQVWIAAQGEARLELRADLLRDFGVEVFAGNAPLNETVTIRRTLDSQDFLAIAAPYGTFEGFISGALTLDTGWLLRYGKRVVRLDDLTLTPGIARNGHPSLEARDPQGRHLLTLTHMHIVAQPERHTLILHNGDLVATKKLTSLLGLAELGRLPIGQAWIDLRLHIPAGAVTDGLGPSCATRPLWPQEGAAADVALIAMNDVAYQGTDPVTGRIKVAPSATLKNVGVSDIPWIAKFTTLGPPHNYPYTPPDQHPFLVWNMYRIFGGRIEQLGASGVKHAFLTLNFDCQINCGNSHVLWLGCEDVYSTGNNNSNFNLGPRDEIEASEGLFFSLCSFFDPNCTGSQTNSSSDFENRLLVDPGDLTVPDADYYLDAWYLAQFDVNIWNTMGYRELDPEQVGGGWDFNLGPFEGGPALDEWVAPSESDPNADYAAVVVPSATPGAPYPNNMPQGHINVLVRVSDQQPGHYRYNYAVQNFDFDRGVEGFHIPIPAGAQVFDTLFGDIDENAANDWTVTVGSDAVHFEAPTTHPLPWFTLFNFEIELDAPPVSSLVILDLGSDAVQPTMNVPVLGPATPAPDLVVVSPGVSDSSPEAGQGFTLSATAQNQGFASSAASTLRYFRSNDSQIDPGDTLFSTDAVGGLAPGGSSPESAAVSIATPGTYWVGACVDAVSGESDAVNNCSAGVQIQVGPPGCSAPDSLTLQNDTVSTTETYEACTTIYVGPAWTVSATGDVTLQAGQSVVLRSGTSVNAGGELHVIIAEPQ